MKRHLNGDNKRRKAVTVRKSKKSEINQSIDETVDSEILNSNDSLLNNENNIITLNQCDVDSVEKELDYNPNLNLLSDYEIINAKNASSSAMVFATKILYKIFHLNELLGHNVSGRNFI